MVVLSVTNSRHGLSHLTRMMAPARHGQGRFPPRLPSLGHWRSQTISAGLDPSASLTGRRAKSKKGEAMDDGSYTLRIRKTWVRTALIVVATALVVAPLTAVASHQFTDVPNSHTFHSDIAWLADAGVTRGCNPPANTRFCPDDNVTRGQMGAFLNRLASNQVVDAGALQGFTVENFSLALQPTVLDSGIEDFSLTSPSGSACFNQDFGVRADSLTVHYQLWRTPEGVNPEQVNVQVRATAGQSGFQVCLSHLDDGGTLPIGTYRTYVFVTYFLGPFGADAVGSDAPTPLTR